MAMRDISLTNYMAVMIRVHQENLRMFVDMLQGGRLTTSKLKNAVTAAGVGAHIRTNGNQHSLAVIGVTDSGFTVTDANSDGRLTIKVRTYTWSSYVNSTYGKRGIAYIKKYVG